MMPHCRAKMPLRETCQEAAEPVNRQWWCGFRGQRGPAARELSAEPRCAQACEPEVTPFPGPVQLHHQLSQLSPEIPGEASFRPLAGTQVGPPSRTPSTTLEWGDTGHQSLPHLSGLSGSASKG